MKLQPATSRLRDVGDAEGSASTIATSRWRDTSVWIILFVAFIILRLVGTRTPRILDELIPLRLFESMDARGVLDPNWRLAELPAELKYDQYNFYLYNILAFFVLKLAAWGGLAPFGTLRVTNIVLQAGGRFALLVTSTLHTYLDPRFYYFRCP